MSYILWLKNQSPAHPLAPAVPKEFTRTRETQPPHPKPSITPLQHSSSFHGSTRWCWGHLCRSSRRGAPTRGLVGRARRHICSQARVCPPVVPQAYPQASFQKSCFMKTSRFSCHCSEEKIRCHFLSYFVKKEDGSSLEYFEEF